MGYHNLGTKMTVPGWLQLSGAFLLAVPRRSRTTKLVASQALGQDRENPIGASTVWGMQEANEIA